MRRDKRPDLNSITDSLIQMLQNFRVNLLEWSDEELNEFYASQGKSDLIGSDYLSFFIFLFMDVQDWINQRVINMESRSTYSIPLTFDLYHKFLKEFSLKEIREEIEKMKEEET